MVLQHICDRHREYFYEELELSGQTFFIVLGYCPAFLFSGVHAELHKPLSPFNTNTNTVLQQVTNNTPNTNSTRALDDVLLLL